MNTLKGWPVVALMASLVFAMSLVGGASAAGVVHRVTVGGPDLCEALGFPIGCDANFSLVALQRADGSVKGQYHDQFSLGGLNGNGFHVAVDCLYVDGNQAWVSGEITHARFLVDIVGQNALTRVVDSGRSANDLPDQISASWINTGMTCIDVPDLPLFSVPQGQVRVQ